MTAKKTNCTKYWDEGDRAVYDGHGPKHLVFGVVTKATDDTVWIRWSTSKTSLRYRQAVAGRSFRNATKHPEPALD